jgi:signal transduction histidine kinase/DNA-binding response OmpR family regulator
LDVLTTEINKETDVVRARQQARRIASLLGFEPPDQVRIATAVSEMARHALENAGGGEVVFSIDGETRPQWLAVKVAEAGRPPSQGAGRTVQTPEERELALVAARRLMDTVAVDAASAEMKVVLRKRFPRHAPLARPEVLLRIAEAARGEATDPLDELARQNRELMQTLAESKRQADALDQLNQELQETNRGVVALYAELDEKAVSLKKADELKSRFLSDMSHEFRTPLNAILALSRLLLDRTDGSLSSEQERQVVYIRRAAESLSDLVNDLLDLAKVESGKIEVHRTEFALSDLTGALRGMFRPLVIGEVSLVVEEPPTLRVVSDEGKLSQILRNFLSNAVKFTERGEIRLSVSVKNGVVRFDVSDTGIGIAERDLERIFEDYVQVDGPRQRRVRGTGLGLPLSKRLAELLGGRIEAKSQLGRGSTFSLILPQTLLSEVGEPAVPEPRAAVLVVEDQQVDLLAATSLLESASIRTRQARSLAEARAALAAERPAAIVLDIRFRDVEEREEDDGWTLLKEIKSSPSTAEIPVLVMTVMQDEARALRLGADAFVSKPAERRSLVRSLLRLLNRLPALRVLHVDDDEASRYAVSQMLFGTGRQLRQAESVSQALSMIGHERPDVILLDLHFPDEDGHAMLARMEREHHRIPTIMLTSAVLDDVTRNRLANAFSILSKRDLSRDTLLDSIDAASAIGGQLMVQ